MSSSATRFGPELKSREKALRRAWYSLGGIWSVPGIPHRLRRCVFISKIYNTALSGLEGFLPSEGEVAK
eukprot:8380224-Pyramimonas_sp.AAC.1